MKKCSVVTALLLAALMLLETPHGLAAQDRHSLGQRLAPPYPEFISGVELTGISGWYGILYPWPYNPTEVTVHPDPLL